MVAVSTAFDNAGGQRLIDGFLRIFFICLALIHLPVALGCLIKESSVGELDLLRARLHQYQISKGRRRLLNLFTEIDLFVNTANKD